MRLHPYQQKCAVCDNRPRRLRCRVCELRCRVNLYETIRRIYFHLPKLLGLDLMLLGGEHLMQFGAGYVIDPDTGRSWCRFRQVSWGQKIYRFALSEHGQPTCLETASGQESTTH